MWATKDNLQKAGVVEQVVEIGLKKEMPLTDQSGAKLYINFFRINQVNPATSIIGDQIEFITFDLFLSSTLEKTYRSLVIIHENELLYITNFVVYKCFVAPIQSLIQRREFGGNIC